MRRFRGGGSVVVDVATDAEEEAAVDDAAGSDAGTVVGEELTVDAVGAPPDGSRWVMEAPVGPVSLSGGNCVNDAMDDMTFR